MTVTFNESNKRLAGFNAYYQREIAPDLYKFEKARRAAIKRALPVAIAGFVAAIGSGTVYAFYGDYAIIPGIASIALFIWAWHIVADAKQDLKVFLARKVLSFFGLTFTDYAGGFYRDQFDELGLLPAYTTANLEDRISGTHDGVTIDIAEAHLLKIKSAGRYASYRTMFRGLLCAFSFPKRFSGRTVIAAEKGWVRKLVRRLKASGERVRLEDRRFEKTFEVHSTDQVEARYLLTPVFMERVLALVDSFKSRRTRLAFDASRLLIVLDLRTDSFEAGSPFESASDPDRVQSLIDDILLIYDLIDVLALRLKTRV